MDTSFCSNFARKEATPLGEIPADILKQQQILLANARLAIVVVGLLSGRVACGLKRVWRRGMLADRRDRLTIAVQSGGFCLPCEDGCSLLGSSDGIKLDYISTSLKDIVYIVVTQRTNSL